VRGIQHLPYTGVTRAKKLVVLVGPKRPLAVAVRTRGAGHRQMVPGDEVLEQMTESLRAWGCWEDRWESATSDAITQARQRLGTEPLTFAQRQER